MARSESMAQTVSHAISTTRFSHSSDFSSFASAGSFSDANTPFLRCAGEFWRTCRTSIRSSRIPSAAHLRICSARAINSSNSCSVIFPSFFSRVSTSFSRKAHRLFEVSMAVRSSRISFFVSSDPRCWSLEIISASSFFLSDSLNMPARESKARLCSGFSCCFPVSVLDDSWFAIGVID